eukprot:CAMPEP_0194080260 /NCGR_PEP_ID=MMETSP0149-20130528/6311_1 /TAXON_ID=122233 /ORGANISM="Chaetoceros debilis, Strain MM31A-1" /LENGTH=66 /DNA_ID=CAMNT_0038761935 /DNA_START=350 /DNA_END=547 /DNA_ORIENTATION=+
MLWQFYLKGTDKSIGYGNSNRSDEGKGTGKSDDEGDDKDDDEGNGVDNGISLDIIDNSSSNSGEGK